MSIRYYKFQDLNVIQLSQNYFSTLKHKLSSLTYIYWKYTSK